MRIKLQAGKVMGDGSACAVNGLNTTFSKDAASFGVLIIMWEMPTTKISHKPSAGLRPGGCDSVTRGLLWMETLSS